MYPSALYLAIAAAFLEHDRTNAVGIKYHFKLLDKADISACFVAEVHKAPGVKQVVLLIILEQCYSATNFKLRRVSLQRP